MTIGRFIVLQLDMDKHPRELESQYHTGDGVLFPVSCDGYYSNQKDANEVAVFLSAKHPDLRTCVARIVSVPK